MSKKKLIVCILFILLLGMLSAFNCYRISDKIHNDIVVEDVQQSAHLENADSTITSNFSNTSNQAINDKTTSESGTYASFQSSIDFESLQASNEDIYAWITIPNTKIDYPIAQHPTDDTYYLSHGADGIYSKYGCPYTELCDNGLFLEFNTVVYGHNMNNGSMFGALHDYEDEEFFNSHRTIYIYTKEHTFTYYVFAAVMYSDAHIPYYYDDNVIEDRDLFLQSLKQDIVKDRSIYDNSVEVTSNSKIITLSTCDKKLRNKRYLVVAVMTEMDGKTIQDK